MLPLILRKRGSGVTQLPGNGLGSVVAAPQPWKQHNGGYNKFERELEVNFYGLSHGYMG